MKYCPYCNTVADDSNTYCRVCGKPLNGDSNAQSFSPNDWNSLYKKNNDPTLCYAEGQPTTVISPQEPVPPEPQKPEPIYSSPSPWSTESVSNYSSDYSSDYSPSQPLYPSSPRQESSSKKDKTWLWITLSVVLLLAIGGGVYYFGFYNAPEPKEEVISTKIDWTPGVYRTSCGMNVRKGPGNSYATLANEQLKTGQEVEILEVKTADDGSIWGKLGTSKWVALSNGKNQYLTKIGE